MKFSIIILSTFLFFWNSWAAGLSEGSCGDSQAEMSECVYNEYMAVDAELNRVYTGAMTGDLLDTKGKSQLKTSQEAWAIFRDAHCELDAHVKTGGGSMESMMLYLCLADLTKTQTNRLEALTDLSL